MLFFVIVALSTTSRIWLHYFKKKTDIATAVSLSCHNYSQSIQMHKKHYKLEEKNMFCSFWDDVTFKKRSAF